jgi:hypothetical protein
MSLRVVDDVEDLLEFRNPSMLRESAIYFHRARSGRTTVGLGVGHAAEPPETFLQRHDVDE